jgi:hypothetical protein
MVDSLGLWESKHILISYGNERLFVSAYIHVEDGDEEHSYVYRKIAGESAREH